MTDFGITGAKNKYRLPIKKLYGSQRDEELDDEETDDDSAALSFEMTVGSQLTERFSYPSAQNLLHRFSFCQFVHQLVQLPDLLH